MKTDTRYAVQNPETIARAVKRKPVTHVSQGEFDEINPEDIVHGEYSDNLEGRGAWFDAVYLDGDVLRTCSGHVRVDHPLIAELKILLRDDARYYVVAIREVAAGVAFKRTDIVDVSVSSLIHATEHHMPSCIWNLQFQDGSLRTLEMEYQSYFSYGATARPSATTNVDVLAKVFPDVQEGGIV